MQHSRDKYRNLFENGVIGMFLSTLSDGTLLEANQAMLDMFGVASFKEVRAVDFYVNPGDRDAFVETLLEKESVHNYEILFKRRNGSTFWGSHSARLNRKRGIIEGLIVDVDDRKGAEEALRRSEIKYRSLFNTANDAILILKGERIIECNQQALTMFGCAKEDMLTLASPLSFAPPVQPDGQNSWEKGLEKVEKALAGEPQFFEFKHMRPDGTFFDADVSLNRIELGGEVLAQSIIRDVTTRKQAEEQLKIAHLNLVLRTAELELVNKELEAFSYSVSHDLRAPLRAIDGFSQALLEDYHDHLDEQGQDFLRRVRGASQRMALLIDDILNLSRISRAELRSGSVDLSALASAVAAELERTNRAHDVKFVIEPNIMVQGDPSLLRIMLENLLDNACKFTGKEPGMVTFGKTLKQERSVLFVKDNGVGFNMAHANKLFVPFQRLHRDDEFEGTGIGLATVQRIIHRHGGQIWAESEVGKGATFYFTV